MTESPATAALRALSWLPPCLPDSKLWRWLPLLIAIQALDQRPWRIVGLQALSPTDQSLLVDALTIVDSEDGPIDLWIISASQPEQAPSSHSTTSGAGADQDLAPWALVLDPQILSTPDLALPSPRLEICAGLDGVGSPPVWHQQLIPHIASLQRRGDELQRLADWKQLEPHLVQRALSDATSRLESQYGEALERLQSQQQALLDTIHQRDQQLHQRDRQLHEIQHSSSWRLTAPLRRGADLLKRPSAPPNTTPATQVLRQPDGAASEPSRISPRFQAAMAQLHPGTPALQQFGDQPFCHERKTLLLVSHDASFSGAPILLWNLVKDLSRDHNLILVSLRRGPLEQQWLPLCHLLVTPVESQQWMDPLVAEHTAAQLVAHYRPDWAVLNTILSWRWPQWLQAHGIPCLSLIHEFATYIFEPLAFDTACRWSSAVVLSSPLTHADLQRAHPALRDTPVELLPQGRCEIPDATPVTTTDEPSQAEATQPFDLSLIPALRSRLSRDWLDQCQLIVGAGTMEYRKGVDLFIRVGARLQDQQRERPLLMLWLEGQHRPEEYGATTMWCQDQLRRSGLESVVVITEAHDHYNAILQRADLFLLTSRLDPLPNVSLDALHLAIPTLTFANATGTASWLEQDDALKTHTVAPYLNTEVMARQAQRLLIDDDLRQMIGQHAQQLAERTFSMERYLLKLRQLGDEACAQQAQKLEACQRIQHSGLFDPTVALSPAEAQPGDLEEMIDHYLQRWQRRIDLRKPCAGFHPAVFGSHHPNQDGDPFDHWIQAGQPKGPWLQPLVARHAAVIPSAHSPRLGLHLHVHHLEGLEEILERLPHNHHQPNLWISITDTRLEASVAALLKSTDLKVMAIQCWANRGRNFGPLLQGLGREMDQACDLYGHLHTKRSQHLAREIGERWRRFLLDHLIGFAGESTLDNIVAAFEQNPRLGLVYPDDPHCTGWTANQAPARECLQSLALTDSERQQLNHSIQHPVDFPIGGMFWVRSGSLTKLWSTPWPLTSLPEEPLATDGTLLHAIERLLPDLCRLSGQTTAVTHVPGSTR